MTQFLSYGLDKRHHESYKRCFLNYDRKLDYEQRFFRESHFGKSHFVIPSKYLTPIDLNTSQVLPISFIKYSLLQQEFLKNFHFLIFF